MSSVCGPAAWLSSECVQQEAEVKTCARACEPQLSKRNWPGRTLQHALAMLQHEHDASRRHSKVCKQHNLHSDQRSGTLRELVFHASNATDAP